MVDDFMASANELYIKFVSSLAYRNSGFKASYIKCKKTWLRTNLALAKTDLTLTAKCGDSILHDPGFIDLSASPEDFHGNEECFWSVSVPATYKIAVMFPKFEV